MQFKWSVCVKLVLLSLSLQENWKGREKNNGTCVTTGDNELMKMQTSYKKSRSFCSFF